MNQQTQGKLIGYVRHGVADPKELQHQLDEAKLKAKGLVLDRVFTDHVSIDALDRPQLEQAFDSLQPGDTLVVQSFDRLARDAESLMQIHPLLKEGKNVYFVDEDLYFHGGADKKGNLLDKDTNDRLKVVYGIYKMEHAAWLERRRIGIEKAKAEGKYRGGVRKKITSEQEQQIRERVAAGESRTSIAKAFGVSTETIRQYMKKEP